MNSIQVAVSIVAAVVLVAGIVLGVVLVKAHAKYVAEQHLQVLMAETQVRANCLSV